MNNLVEFFRMFFSYVLVLIVYAAVAGAGIFCGLTWNKKKAAKAVTEPKEQPAQDE